MGDGKIGVGRGDEGTRLAPTPSIEIHAHPCTKMGAGDTQSCVRRSSIYQTSRAAGFGIRNNQQQADARILTDESETAAVGA